MKMVPPRGLEPRLADSKSAVLPLDDGGVREGAFRTAPAFASPRLYQLSYGPRTRRDSNPQHRLAFAPLLALALAACQTPATKTVVQEVRVPVAVQPIKPADVPALPTPLPKRPADARQALDVALAQVCRWVAFGLRAEPLLRVSAGLPPQEPPAYPECSKR
jgi:hypothetical protein